ncbi:DNA polymerase delta catalytic subunit [Chlorella vulgaris]
MAPKRQGPAHGPQTPGKRAQPVTVEYERARLAAPCTVHLRHQRQRPAVPALGAGLCFMVTDVIEGSEGRFSIWGTTPAGASVLLRTAFQPYFYIAAPKGQVVAASQRGVDGMEAEDEQIDWDAAQLDRIKASQRLLNSCLSGGCRIDRVEAVQRKPIMFFRPDLPDGETYLKLSVAGDTSLRRVSTAVHAIMVSGNLRAKGLVWRDLTLYEAEVSLLQRLLVDVPLSGGAWLYVPSAAAAAEVIGPNRTPPAAEAAATSTTDTAAAAAAAAAAGAQRGPPGGGWRAVLDGERVSSCDLEIVAPWHALVCLSPDATQLADPSWSPFASSSDGCGSSSSEAQPAAEAVPPAARQAADAAKRGDIAGLRMMVLDVLAAAADGADRVAVASKGDPVVAISCTFFPFSAQGHSAPPTQQQQRQQQQEGAVTNLSSAAAPPGQGPGDSGGEEEEGEEVLLVATAAAAAGGPTAAGARRPLGASAAAAMGVAAAAAAASETLVFLLHPRAAAQQQEVAERSVGAAAGGGGARVLLFETEADMLSAWAACVNAADPDVIALFEVSDTLAILQDRFAALQLSLKISRMLPRFSRPMSVKKVTMYSAQWVRSQSRMSSTSNQETWRADIDGRIVVDVLRQVLTAQNLSSFSLTDCVQSLLGQTIEAIHVCQLPSMAYCCVWMQVLRPGCLAGLLGLAGPPPQLLHHQRLVPGTAAMADALRVARYALRRCDAVGSLLQRLATVPEMFEMARATGLTLGQAVNQAQMIRTYSLLLRTARRQNFLVPGRQEAKDLQEHTFILHPVETGTVGLYKQPVAILDFSSLYPSIYRAHNLCYSTLLHKDDQALLPADQQTITPTGAAFVKPSVRPGILPGILAALIAARGATRELLKAATDPATRAVLDSRQKALKVTANALYGFTGAGASPLQCIQLADSCLAFGAQGCRRAKQVVEEAAASGKLAPYGGGARVVYGHTDSLFLHLPQAADARQAIAAGRLASKLVTAAFPPPMELKFERVCHPFLLLHVNRYAGRAFERDEDVDQGGELICKGLKSMWRQTAPVLRKALHGALVRILMEDNLRGALDFVSGEIRRLLSGQVELHELIMTGGLWRVTGQQVENAAEGKPNSEEVKGPHASLAVRLSQRDPGRTFVLGERLPYVLLAGEKLQEDAAEDPLTAAKAGREGDLGLYWKNKLQKPLEEVFRACVPPSQQKAVLQELTGGDHTRVKVDSLNPPPPALGPASPPPRGVRGGGGSQGAAGAARQSRMAAFFRAVPKCLGCKASMPGWKGDLGEAPGLCDSCARTEGRWEDCYVNLLEEQAGVEARQCSAYAACRDCHSGGAVGPVLCENGECPVTYTRLGCSSRLQLVDKQLRRMDIW